MPDGVISAAEADRDFSRVLRDVEAGARVTIMKDGRPVAVLAPVEEGTSPRRGKARERMLALLHEGLPLGFSGALDRDALHDR
ncbi:type II toxin-antitoxin system prevent-host-death family antitoxin [Arenibaculum sp.]|jgi:prevent-host-death family protein|uniref:type II toxin-antitoxin system Phd/YefM family antitoxin n=1 Tax=Arenibaculum sp. TaxID=2865862 RepID=UPI002E153611|nr:type II toxin-antitoxin system prevent-host-death family antitoxin [Arenibaculum sp.]